MRAGAMVWGIVLALVPAACRSERRGPPPPSCSMADPDACHAACLAGVLGEGGCLTAATSYEIRARTDGVVALQRASDAYDRACAGAVATSCASLARLIAAPFRPPERDAADGGAAARPVMSDEDAARRERALAGACRDDKGAACVELAMAMIGVDAARAREAVAAARGSQSPWPWRGDPAELLAMGEDAASKCAAGETFACGRLADLVRRFDPPRATRLLRAECVARGIGEVNRCVEARDAQPPRWPDMGDGDGYGGSTPSREQLPRLFASIRIAFEPVHGIDGSEVEKLQKRVGPGVRACYEKAIPKSGQLVGEVSLTLLVDRAGYPLILRHHTDLPSASLLSCVMRRFDEEKLGLAPLTSFALRVKLSATYALGGR